MSRVFDKETMVLLDKLKYTKISYSDVLDYLNYEDEFYEFLENRVILVDHYRDCFGDNSFYSVLTKYDKERLLDLKVIIPKVVDITTAIIVVHELRHAHDLYKSIGITLSKNIEEYENIAIEEEKRFIKKICKKIEVMK